MHTESDLVDRIQEIGVSVRRGDVVDAATFSGLRRFPRFNIQSKESWRAIASDLSDDQLGDLICGLSAVETELRWGGGSAAGVIWLFKILESRNAALSLLNDVSAYVLANSSNRYNPFGTRISLGARNYSEYQERSRLRNFEIAKCVAADKEVERQAAEERDLRKEMAAKGVLARKNGLRPRVIDALDTLTLEEKLTKIAFDPDYPPQFFPGWIAHACSHEVIASLPREVRLELARRLKGRRRGPWRLFRGRLLASLGEVWNKPRWGI